MNLFNQQKILMAQNQKISNFSPKKISDDIISEENKNDVMDIESEKKHSSQNSFIKNFDKDNEMQKIKFGNDSLNNTDNSLLENYSTANSNVEIEKKKHKIYPKNNMDYSENEDKFDETKSIEICKENKMELVEEPQTNNEDEYLDEILENLKGEEINNKYKINQNYFNFQNEINNKMRIVLINWLIEVHTKLNFKEETFYTTIYIMDAYLSRKFIQRKKFQLLGVTALYIATKLNEIYIRRIKDYVFITDYAYDEEEIIKMESDICKTLNFNFLIPTSLSFYEILAKKIGLDKNPNQLTFGKFLIQSFLINSKSLNYNYSMISLASCYLVMRVFEIENYKYIISNILNLFSSCNIYNEVLKIFEECFVNICKTIGEMINSNVKSTIKKYSYYNFDQDVKKIITLFNDEM